MLRDYTTTGSSVAFNNAYEAASSAYNNLKSFAVNQVKTGYSLGLGLLQVGGTVGSAVPGGLELASKVNTIGSAVRGGAQAANTFFSKDSLASNTLNNVDGLVKGAQHLSIDNPQTTIVAATGVNTLRNISPVIDGFCNIGEGVMSQGSAIASAGKFVVNTASALGNGVLGTALRLEEVYTSYFTDTKAVNADLDAHYGNLFREEDFVSKPRDKKLAEINTEKDNLAKKFDHLGKQISSEDKEIAADFAEGHYLTTTNLAKKSTELMNKEINANKIADDTRELNSDWVILDNNSAPDEITFLAESANAEEASDWVIIDNDSAPDEITPLGESANTQEVVELA